MPLRSSSTLSLAFSDTLHHRPILPQSLSTELIRPSSDDPQPSMKARAQTLAAGVRLLGSWDSGALGCGTVIRVSRVWASPIVKSGYMWFKWTFKPPAASGVPTASHLGGHTRLGQAYQGWTENLKFPLQVLLGRVLSGFFCVYSRALMDSGGLLFRSRTQEEESGKVGLAAWLQPRLQALTVPNFQGRHCLAFRRPLLWKLHACLGVIAEGNALKKLSQLAGRTRSQVLFLLISKTRSDHV